MKYFIAFILLLILSIASYSQTTQLIRVDTLNGADTLTFTTDRLKRPNGFIGLEASCKQLDGSSTSDYMIAQASQSGNSNGFATLTLTENNVYAAVNDTITISDGKVGLWGVTGLPYDYFQVKAIGVAGDTTIIAVYYVAKRY